MGSPKALLPYSTQTLDEEDIQAVVEVLRSPFLTQGPAVAAFEAALCELTKAPYCVAVSNGTAALHLCMLALEIGPGDEVITTGNTFAASANAVRYVGATPVFADILPGTANLDPNAVRQKITPKTKAIVAVDFSGCPTDLAEFRAIADEYNLFLIDDAAHSLGATYQGSPIGSGHYADLTTLSFHPVKSITTGEGGAITTQNPELFEKMMMLRTHGITKDPRFLTKNDGPWYYEMQELGYNYRITDIQAALGTSQLKKFPEFLAKRRAIAKRYDQELKNLPNLKLLEVPEDRESGHHLYVIQLDYEAIGKTRAEVMMWLRDRKIGTQVHYIPVYQQPAYADFGINPSDFPFTEQFYNQALSIPIYPKLTAEEQSYVIATLKELVQ